MPKKLKKTKRREQRTQTRRRPRPTVCPFDENKTEPTFKNYQDLARFISDRGKILSREQTGVCAKHQRRLSREIKRARHLALLPFVVRPI